jgi:hypothetical protein
MRMAMDRVPAEQGRRATRAILTFHLKD